MKNKQYLTFSLHNFQYGIESTLVQEILPLPELTPITESPADMIGILNWRGQLVPVIYLGFIEGHTLQDCRLSDFVIIGQWESLQIGMVVNQVNELLELDADVIETEISSVLPSDINTTFIAGIAGVAKVDSGMIVLLNFEALINQEALLNLIWNAQIQLEMMSASATNNDVNQTESELPHTNFYDLYCSKATPKERAIFQQRAENIRQSISSLEATKPMPLAVIRFGNEFFGLDLELVQEISTIRNLTPIPHSPNHIVGNMHLRGQIVTLVDIRNILHLPIASVTVGCMTVVVQVDDIVAGIAVDEVLELIYLNHSDMTSFLPPTSNANKQYLQGTASFQEKMLSVLDLPKIFTKGGLAVSEAC